ncbi:hypothetical protein SAMN05446037_10932 [Anaerovirgula multivorans]|uniref:Uncharacterized protein n=1 Tax=Anaerovirgula multivorans TaxID=312168 RepID=A0A239LNX6_9FIRM|nr:hypothetical protein SAMN05446037_10932 [Anaerovirgula multivorans]
MNLGLFKIIIKLVKINLYYVEEIIHDQFIFRDKTISSETR